jgi:hypothetical protein
MIREFGKAFERTASVPATVGGNKHGPDFHLSEIQ